MTKPVGLAHACIVKGFTTLSTWPDKKTLTLWQGWDLGPGPIGPRAHLGPGAVWAQGLFGPRAHWPRARLGPRPIWAPWPGQFLGTH